MIGHLVGAPVSLKIAGPIRRFGFIVVRIRHVYGIFRFILFPVYVIEIIENTPPDEVVRHIAPKGNLIVVFILANIAGQVL